MAITLTRIDYEKLNARQKELLDLVLRETEIGASRSWADVLYSFPSLSKRIEEILEPYKIAARPL